MTIKEISGLFRASDCRGGPLAASPRYAFESRCDRTRQACIALEVAPSGSILAWLTAMAQSVKRAARFPPGPGTDKACLFSYGRQSVPILSNTNESKSRLIQHPVLPHRSPSLCGKNRNAETANAALSKPPRPAWSSLRGVAKSEGRGRSYVIFSANTKVVVARQHRVGFLRRVALGREKRRRWPRGVLPLGETSRTPISIAFFARMVVRVGRLKGPPSHGGSGRCRHGTAHSRSPKYGEGQTEPPAAASA